MINRKIFCKSGPRSRDRSRGEDEDKCNSTPTDFKPHGDCGNRGQAVVYIVTYLPTYIPLYLVTYLAICLHLVVHLIIVYIVTILHHTACIPLYLVTHLSPCIHPARRSIVTYLHPDVRLIAYLVTCSPAYLPASRSTSRHRLHRHVPRDQLPRHHQHVHRRHSRKLQPGTPKSRRFNSTIQ